MLANKRFGSYQKEPPHNKTGLKMYKCSVCGKVFKEADLSKHFESHPVELNNRSNLTKKNRHKFCIGTKVDQKKRGKPIKTCPL
jgi:uncharacterized C2H2 Zn-finger protein